MFLPQNISYILKNIDSKISTLKDELAEQEKNNDAQYATETRKKITEIEACKVAFKELNKQAIYNYQLKREVHTDRMHFFDFILLFINLKLAY